MDARVKLTELLFCTELTLAITVEPGVPLAVAVPDEVGVLVLALPPTELLLSVLLPGKR